VEIQNNQTAAAASRPHLRQRRRQFGAFAVRYSAFDQQHARQTSDGNRDQLRHRVLGVHGRSGALADDGYDDSQQPG